MHKCITTVLVLNWIRLG